MIGLDREEIVRFAIGLLGFAIHLERLRYTNELVADIYHHLGTWYYFSLYLRDHSHVRCGSGVMEMIRRLLFRLLHLLRRMIRRLVIERNHYGSQSQTSEEVSFAGSESGQVSFPSKILGEEGKAVMCLDEVTRLRIGEVTG